MFATSGREHEPNVCTCTFHFYTIACAAAVYAVDTNDLRRRKAAVFGLLPPCRRRTLCMQHLCKNPCISTLLSTEALSSPGLALATTVGLEDRLALGASQSVGCDKTCPLTSTFSSRIASTMRGIQRKVTEGKIINNDLPRLGRCGAQIRSTLDPGAELMCTLLTAIEYGMYVTPPGIPP